VSIDQTFADLQARLRDGVVIDPDLRAKIVAQYDGGTLNGIPDDAAIRVGWERARSDKTLRKDLDRLDRLVQERWSSGLPPDFRHTYERYGRLWLRAQWDDDGDDDGFGWQWAWPSRILESTWVSVPAWEGTLPDGSHQTVFHPIVPFMNVDESEPVALVYRHSRPSVVPSVEWIIPDCFAQDDGGLLYKTASGNGFADWLTRWINAGFCRVGSVYDGF
jgi:hypothetical protein